MKRKIYIGTGIGVLALITLFLIIGSGVNGYTALDEYSGNIEFHKALSCGCCGLHSDYLSGKGNLDVKVMKMDSVESVKDEYGIPEELRTCHTAVIDGYFVEGHVPLEAINKLMEEKPNIAGIALPGMPSGSPGMPGPKTEEWIIYAVNYDGTSEEFMRI